MPVDALDHFTNETPTAIVVRQILGAVSLFENVSLDEKLRKASECKRIETEKQLKNLILLEKYFLLVDLKNQIEAFIQHYSHHRYHESRKRTHTR